MNTCLWNLSVIAVHIGKVLPVRVKQQWQDHAP